MCMSVFLLKFQGHEWNLNDATCATLDTGCQRRASRAFSAAQCNMSHEPQGEVHLGD